MERDLQDGRIAELERQLGALQVQVAALQEQNAALREQVAALQEQNHRLREENQALKDEVARLKKQKTKPKIGPSKLNEEERRKRRNQRKKGERKEPKVDRTVVVKAKGVPEGSRFKGFDDFTVQELVIKTQTTLYRIEKWRAPNGELVRGTCLWVRLLRSLRFRRRRGSCVSLLAAGETPSIRSSHHSREPRGV